MRNDELLTKRQAIKTLRSKGRSKKASEAAVAKMTTTSDGCRQKVTLSQVEAEIDKLFAPVDITIRPISPKVRERWFGGETR